MVQAGCFHAVQLLPANIRRAKPSLALVCDPACCWAGLSFFGPEIQL